ncbi:MAG: Threonine--tRNA ligase [Thermotogales bacterium 46_20]|nr:MAG: Threonine--tRNA ligase [Thermotogales bacterium 46_20]
MEIKVQLPDNSIQEHPAGVRPLDIANQISEGLAKRAIGAKVDEELWDLKRPLESDCKLLLILDRDEDAVHFYRHTFSHILAQAVKRLFGEHEVKLGIGPVIENGFYYDFDIGTRRFSEDDLKKIEEEMRKIIDEDLAIERFELPKDEAIKLMKEEGETYKIELIQELEAEKVSFYRQGDFVDLCRGPHAPSTGKVKHFKLVSVSGAYWRGDERNAMLQRIYGTAFAKKSDLEAHLKMIEEAKKRDHRKLGPQLGLFGFSYDYAPGMGIYHPKGTVILNELMRLARELHEEHGYREINTPLVMNEALWHKSGHWDHYRDNMYFIEKDEQKYAIKPMNCPGHMLVYKADTVSYRDLPLKLFEFGRVHRYERSGVLHGLFRVRGFIQDDAHIFCTRDQMEEEIEKVIEFVNLTYSPFGFNYRAELSTRPEDFMGNIESWELATRALKNALEHSGLEHRVNEGDGAFYGPKIDFHIRDSLGREWQCATIQLDFLMPERFELTYIDAENKEVQPVMIHRAIYGSIDRFFGIIVEHFGGAFPTWLAPVQVKIIAIADRHAEYAWKVASTLKQKGLRVEVDDRQRSTNYKIREAQMEKIPYMLIVGDMEQSAGTVAVRLRNETDLGSTPLEEFSKKVLSEIRDRSLESPFE